MQCQVYVFYLSCSDHEAGFYVSQNLGTCISYLAALKDGHH